MPVTFASFTKIIVAASLIFVTASVLALMTAPSGSGGEHSFSVERANKGDRLPYTSGPKTWANSSSLATTPQMPPQRRPLGCDPAFSSLADSTGALIYKRCAA